jgi:hypothetical protein
MFISQALIVLVFFGFVGFMVWLRHSSRLEKRRLQVEAQTRILDRIGTGEALTAFLQTEEGKALLRSNEAFGESGQSPRRHDGIRMSVIGLLTGGVICIGIGAGFVVAAEISVDRDLFIPAGIVAGVGVGCIVAAIIHYALGKAWGMLGNGHGQDGARSRSL